MIKVKFLVKDLKDQELPYEAPKGGEILQRNLIGKSRWSLRYELIFRFKDQPKDTAWKVYYNDGATENQNEAPWEYERWVDAFLLTEVEKVVKVWEPINDLENPGKFVPKNIGIKVKKMMF